jgi:hypothetical protein
MASDTIGPLSLPVPHLCQCEDPCAYQLGPNPDESS